MFLHRVGIILCNIFLPPLAVLLIAGAAEDFWLNCALFLLAVFPAHIHGMYISFTYFSRKRKVRKGRWPGKHRGLIFSEKVQRGGATPTQLDQIAARAEWDRRRREAAGLAKGRWG